MLAVPDLDTKMRMKVDASDYAMRVYYQWKEKMRNRDQSHFSQSP